MSLADLFPEDDFRFHMGVQRGDGDFFKPTERHAELIAERQRWLRAEPEHYSAFLPEAASLLEGCIEVALAAHAFSKDEHAVVNSCSDSVGRCRCLGEILEPDFLLLKADANGALRLVGGCVVFPSSWSLAEKVGKPIESIHAPVPTLNAQLGRSIHSFLGRLAPGVVWLRHNWGLSRSPELNQHPRRAVPRLDASVNASDVWLRIERQAFVSLPRSGGILFAIRIRMHSLADVSANSAAVKGLLRALQTMPPEIARYKGLAGARERIIELLQEGPKQL